MDSGNLPMPGNAVLPCRSRTHAAPRTCGVTAAFDTLECANISQPKSLQPGESETAGRARYVAERVAP